MLKSNHHVVGIHYINLREPFPYQKIFKKWEPFIVHINNLIKFKKKILNRYIMFGRGICENTSRKTKNLVSNVVSRLVFFANTPPKHDISV
jgi:hypothetical protein